MATTLYDRYELFKNNGTMLPVPVIPMQPMDGDKFLVYRKGVSGNRLDNLSLKYYGNSFHGFLIMAANLQYGNREYDIPDGTVIRIPFPFKNAIEQYKNNINEYIYLNGL